MAIIGFIVKGDRTSHGGHVVECTSHRYIDGLLVARVGDPVWCPRCNRMTKIVTSRFPQVKDNGVPSAFDLDVTDCGAQLYSRHNNHAGYGTSDPAPTAGLGSAKAAANNPRKTGETVSAQEHFVLREIETGKVLTGLKYKLSTATGRVIEGETDEKGRTGVVWTEGPEGTELVVDNGSGPCDDPYHYSETMMEII